MEADPYALLGVSADATIKEIDRARAYSQRILTRLSPSLGVVEAAAKAAAIDAAWTLLRDPERRTELDVTLAERVSQSQAANSQANATAYAIQTTGTHLGSFPVGANRTNGAPGKTCSVCLSAPAMNMHFRQRVARSTIESVSGFYCRTCGIATFRDTTNRTLIKGFWRARSLPTTIAIVRGNIVERRRMNRLGPSDDQSLALDPGRPLFIRSGVVAVTVSALMVFSTIATIADMSGSLSKDNPIGNQLHIG